MAVAWSLDTVGMLVRTVEDAAFELLLPLGPGLLSWSHHHAPNTNARRRIGYRMKAMVGCRSGGPEWRCRRRT